MRGVSSNCNLAQKSLQLAANANILLLIYTGFTCLRVKDSKERRVETKVFFRCIDNNCN